MRKFLATKYSYSVERTEVFKRFMNLLVAGQSSVYQALQREKDLDKFFEQDAVDDFDGVYRSKPATYFAEQPHEPLTLDQVLKEYSNTGKKKKKVVKRLINIDKKKQDIKDKVKLSKTKTENITKRVEKFLYLSNVRSQMQISESKNKVEKEKEKEKEKSPNKSSYIRPMTSRSNRIRICTDMKIMSLESMSPRREDATINSVSKGRATFYTENKSASNLKSRNTLLREHKSQSKISVFKLNQKKRPFTARLASPRRSTKKDSKVATVQVIS